jgi:hypothetical protein
MTLQICHENFTHSFSVKSYPPQLLDEIIIGTAHKDATFTHKEFCRNLLRRLSEEIPPGDPRVKFIESLREAKIVPGWNCGQNPACTRLDIDDAWVPEFAATLTDPQNRTHAHDWATLARLICAHYVLTNTDLLPRNDPRLRLVQMLKAAKTKQTESETSLVA